MKAKSPSQILIQASACAEKLKVLSDPTRMQILESLRIGPQHVSALMKNLNIEQSLLSHHLRTLRAAGLVKSQRDGKAMLYRLASSVMVHGGAEIDLGCCRLVFD
jgi:ArsR family transcriptional regulator, nickel/cobalt-responsive transcriptional repressor